ncbi:MAG: type II toxin-antitoxin system death-on-curing family toxin [Chitinophagaceae bacterium]
MIRKEHILDLHKISIELYGGSLGIRDEGYLQSAIERPFSTFGGEDLYTTPFHKAAAILESILKNHPFIDGNKRTGFYACGSILKSYNWVLVASNKQAYDFVIQVASTHMDFDDIVTWIQEHSERP